MTFLLIEWSERAKFVGHATIKPLKWTDPTVTIVIGWNLGHQAMFVPGFLDVLVLEMFLVFVFVQGNAHIIGRIGL